MQAQCKRNLHFSSDLPYQLQLITFHTLNHVLFHRTISRLTFESASLALYTHFEKCSRSL
jgi:hypothetical protein